MERNNFIAVLITCLTLYGSTAFSADENYARAPNYWAITPPPDNPDKPSSLPLLIEIEAALGITSEGNKPKTQLVTATSSTLPFEAFQLWETEQWLKPGSSFAAPSMWFALALEYELSSWLWIELLADTGVVTLINQELYISYEPEIQTEYQTPFFDILQNGEFLRGLSITLGDSAAQVQIGRVFDSIGDGLIYANYGLGALLRVSFEEPLQVPLTLTSSTQLVGSSWEDYANGNLLSSLHLEYALSHFESIYFFGALFSDTSGALSVPMVAPLAEKLVYDATSFCSSPQDLQRCVETQKRLTDIVDSEQTTSTGQLQYLGMGANLSFRGNLRLNSTGILLFGESVVTSTPTSIPHGRRGAPAQRTLSGEIKAWAGQLNGTWSLDERWEVSWLNFGLSGNSSPLSVSSTNVYNNFIGISPYWGWSGLFFNSGMNRNLYTSQTLAAGVNGHGVIGSGPRINYSTTGLNIETKLLALSALKSSPESNQSLYGIEWNASAVWSLYSNISLSGEANLLFPGNFFPQNDIAYRVLGYINVQYSN